MIITGCVALNLEDSEWFYKAGKGTDERLSLITFTRPVGSLLKRAETGGGGRVIGKK